jgi:hypothetical protein
MSLGRILRQNAFLVAAVALPLLVVLFFVGASAIPRWFVPPPAYDLLLRTTEPSGSTAPQTSVEFRVRDGHVEATARKVDKHWSEPALYLYDAETGSARKVAVDLPRVLPDNETERTIVVEELTGRRVLNQRKAPDGYELQMVNQRAPGIVGDLFGMGRYDSGVAIANRGRVIRITLSTSSSQPDVVGWVER